MKKILMLSAAMLLLPFFSGAATLNNAFNINTLFPSLNGTASVSSTCGILGANSSVSFALTQNGNYTQLPTSLSTDSNGSFSGSVAFPSSFNPGSATLVATCNRTGDTINSPVLTFAAPASGFFGFPTTSPMVGGIYTLSGACGNTNGAGIVQLAISQNGNNYSLDNASLSSTGTFSHNVAIPNNLSIGQATFTAACSNGSMFSSNVNIGPVAVNAFAFSVSPLPGAYTTISGNCTNVSGNQNGTVNFSILRSGTISSLPATNNLTNNIGTFNSSVFFPDNVGSNPATFVVTCPNGSTFSNLIMLGAAYPAVLGDTTPVGGVDAGSGPQNYFDAGILFISHLLGLLVP